MKTTLAKLFAVLLSLSSLLFTHQTAKSGPQVPNDPTVVTSIGNLSFSVDTATTTELDFTASSDAQFFNTSTVTNFGVVLYENSPSSSLVKRAYQNWNAPWTIAFPIPGSSGTFPLDIYILINADTYEVTTTLTR